VQHGAIMTDQSAMCGLSRRERHACCSSFGKECNSLSSCSQVDVEWRSFGVDGGDCRTIHTASMRDVFLQKAAAEPNGHGGGTFAAAAHLSPPYASKGRDGTLIFNGMVQYFSHFFCATAMYTSKTKNVFMRACCRHIP
jgi:hypothetical protein